MNRMKRKSKWDRQLDRIRDWWRYEVEDFAERFYANEGNIQGGLWLLVILIWCDIVVTVCSSVAH